MSVPQAKKSRAKGFNGASFMDAGYWYNQDKDSVHEALYPYIKILIRQNHYHYFELLRNHKLYSNQNIATYSAFSHFRNISNKFDDYECSSLNVVASCVDTAVSRIARDAKAYGSIRHHQRKLERTASGSVDLTIL